MSELTDQAGNARIVLGEVEQLVKSLLERDEGGSIDLQRLPLTREDHAFLQEVLGEGEILAEVQGSVEVRQSEVPGVWWVTYLNPEGEVIADFIEVGYCPEILIAPVDDVRDGLELLRARLFHSRYGQQNT